jgi:(p)ppGpp synthase/HD superfamily hydrolase
MWRSAVILKFWPKMLDSRYSDALAYAFKLHSYQTRKGSTTPYIAHLMSVSALVLENGGNEDQAIAALLHDAVEDQGGLKTLQAIRERFGDRVAQIVQSCTDSYTSPKPPWRERKERYLAELRNADAEIQLVSLADKVHNARCLLADLQQSGPVVWSWFQGRKNGTLWYYHTLAEFFADSQYPRLSSELVRVVTEIERLADLE